MCVEFALHFVADETSAARNWISDGVVSLVMAGARARAAAAASGFLLSVMTSSLYRGGDESGAVGLLAGVLIRGREGRRGRLELALGVVLGALLLLRAALVLVLVLGLLRRGAVGLLAVSMGLHSEDAVDFVEDGEQAVLLAILVDDVADAILWAIEHKGVGHAVLEVGLEDLGEQIGVEVLMVCDFAVSDEERAVG